MPPLRGWVLGTLIGGFAHKISSWLAVLSSQASRGVWGCPHVLVRHPSLMVRARGCRDPSLGAARERAAPRSQDDNLQSGCAVSDDKQSRKRYVPSNRASHSFVTQENKSQRCFSPSCLSFCWALVRISLRRGSESLVSEASRANAFSAYCRARSFSPSAKYASERLSFASADSG